MGPTQTPVNAPSYSTGLRSQTEAGRASAKTIGTGVCERPSHGGPRCGLRLKQWSSRSVGGGWQSVRTAFVDAEPTPSRGPSDRRGDHHVLGSHRATTFFSVRLRTAQHVTHRLAAHT